MLGGKTACSLSSSALHTIANILILETFVYKSLPSPIHPPRHTLRLLPSPVLHRVRPSLPSHSYIRFSTRASWLINLPCCTLLPDLLSSYFKSSCIKPTMHISSAPIYSLFPPPPPLLVMPANLLLVTRPPLHTLPNPNTPSPGFHHPEWQYYHAPEAWVRCDPPAIIAGDVCSPSFVVVIRHLAAVRRRRCRQNFRRIRQVFGLCLA